MTEEGKRHDDGKRGIKQEDLQVAQPFRHCQLQSVTSAIPVQPHGLTTVLVTVQAGGMEAQLNVGQPGPSV
jgi:hypothetical protein